MRRFRRGAIAAFSLTIALTGLLGVGTAAAGTHPVGGQSSTTMSPGDTCTPQSILDGDHYSDLQLAQTAQQGGFSGQGWVVSVAVALAESSGWTRAVLIDADCSRDRGLWQINSYWHSEVSDAQAFDPVGCAQAAFTISSGGNDWTPWTTYQNGAYQQYMARAQAAVSQAGG